jgi:hypothetical protein
MLQAASEIAGGDKALARHLGLSESLLGLYMAGTRPLPDALLLRAVDLILEDRMWPRPADRHEGLPNP